MVFNIFKIALSYYAKNIVYICVVLCTMKHYYFIDYSFIVAYVATYAANRPSPQINTHTYKQQMYACVLLFTPNSAPVSFYSSSAVVSMGIRTCMCTCDVI